MTDTTRFGLLEQITDYLSDAIQADMENGVASLNDKAAQEFRKKYPAISAFHGWLSELYLEEMPDD